MLTPYEFDPENDLEADRCRFEFQAEVDGFPVKIAGLFKDVCHVAGSVCAACQSPIELDDVPSMLAFRGRPYCTVDCAYQDAEEYIRREFPALVDPNDDDEGWHCQKDDAAWAKGTPSSVCYIDRRGTEFTVADFLREFGGVASVANSYFRTLRGESLEEALFRALSAYEKAGVFPPALLDVALGRITLGLHPGLNIHNTAAALALSSRLRGRAA